MRLLRPRLLALTGVAVLASAGAAAADDAVAPLFGGPIAAEGGWLAYSAGDTATGRYRLTLRHGDATVTPGVPAQDHPFDVRLGRDASGAVVATYSRDEKAFVLPVDGGRERGMRAVTGRATSPAVWRDRVAWVQPGPGAAGAPFKHCDRLLVRSGAGRPRVVSRACRVVQDVSIRGRTVVWSSFDFRATDSHGAGGKTSSIKVFRFGAGAARAVETTSFGEETNVLSSPVIRGNEVLWTQSGIHPAPAFSSARVDGNPRARTVLAGIALDGPLAVDGQRTYYSALGRGEQGCEAGDQLAPVPCTLIRTRDDVLAAAERTLPPQLSVAYTPAQRPPAGVPLTLAGRLDRPVVARGRTLRTVPVPGVGVEALRRVDRTTGRWPEGFDPTGLTATTDADGRWAVEVPAPDAPYFSAIAPSLGVLAGRGTVGYQP